MHRDIGLARIPTLHAVQRSYSIAESRLLAQRIPDPARISQRKYAKLGT